MLDFIRIIHSIHQAHVLRRHCVHYLAEALAAFSSDVRPQQQHACHV